MALVVIILIGLVIVGFFYFRGHPDSLRVITGSMNGLYSPENVAKMTAMADKLEKQADQAEAVKKQRDRIYNARARIEKARQ